MTSLPALLSETNGGVHYVVEGSVIQLYCLVQSTTASFTWTKDENPVVLDIPHLRERSYYDSTFAASVLTVDNFLYIDNGVYQCNAEDGNPTITGYGDRIKFRGICMHAMLY